MIDPAAPELSSFDSSAARPGAIVAELIVGRRRLTGELRWGGGPRRFVDVINAIEGSFAFVYDAELDDPFDGAAQRQRFDVTQVHRDSILFAVPRAGPEQHFSPFEAVRKVPVPCMMALPGFTITGNVHQVPGADATRVPQVGSRQFVPVTEATITCCDGPSTVWREPLVAVNMAQAMFYAPNPKAE
jgi:hypothetical protein